MNSPTSKPKNEIFLVQSKEFFMYLFYGFIVIRIKCIEAKNWNEHIKSTSVELKLKLLNILQIKSFKKNNHSGVELLTAQARTKTTVCDERLQTDS